MAGDAIRKRLAAVDVVILDVDGVLTDGKVLIDADGRESVRFDIQDGYGIVRAQREGLRFAIISGRDTPAVRARADQLGIEELHLGALDKTTAFADLMSNMQVEAGRIAYIGDDLNDLSVMEQVGIVCAVANARPEVRTKADLVTNASGGNGAVREFIEQVLAARGEHA